MECRFCLSEGKLEEVNGFKACNRCIGKVIPFCESMVRQVEKKLNEKGWHIEVISDEKDWITVLSSVLNKNEILDEERKAILFAIRCKKGDITTITFIDRMSVLAATSAALSRILASPKQGIKRATIKKI